VRLFDEERGTELTVHTGLPDDQSIRLQVRLYAPDGHRLTDIVGGVELTLQFSPGSLANAIRVPGRPLEAIITPTAPTGTSGSQTVRLDFPGTGTSKSFGPFHVEVQPGISGVREFRVFDAFNADFTAHVPLVSGKVHLEASVFNGAHPNEVRTNFDYRGARFNSFSARVTVNPNEHWSVAASAAYIDPHEHQPLYRLEVSALHVAGGWSTTFIWGANVPTDTRRVLNTALFETNIEVDQRNAIFGRAEYVTRTAEELALVGSISSEVEVGSLAVGYARRISRLRGVGAWLGARGNVDFVPQQLRLFYGSRTPAGVLVYLGVRP